MIATLSGAVAEKLGGLVVLDVGGVGYGVRVTVEDLGHLPDGKEAKLYIHEHLRENEHELYGFLESSTLALFEMLLDVNSVGPKMAQSILSIGTTAEVRQAIADGNVKFLQAATGVGKRAAERVVVDLKDKVGLGAGGSDLSFLKASVSPSDDAIQALLGLGYTAQDAQSALAGIDPELPVEERVKQALKGAV